MQKVKQAERALAHIESVEWIKPIEGADSIELIGVLGWVCIAKKDEFKVNDKCVYIEIDSLAPNDDKRFEFLESKKYKIKTMKLNKFNVISQGLALPITLFPEISEKKIGSDVTKELKITYYSEEDRQRKTSSKSNKKDKYNRMAARLAYNHKWLFNTKLVRFLMKKEWGKELLFMFFGSKKDKPKDFPSWIVKTDETRIENAPFYLKLDERWIKTEKLDGTSCTYAIDTIKKFGKPDYEFIVCSRNIRQMDKEQSTYQLFDGNVYWEMADKYNIKDILINFVKKNNCNRVVLQGECIGETIQKNPYKIKGREFYVFNLIIDGERVSTLTMKDFCLQNQLNHVPIIDDDYTLPDNMEDMKLEADGFSVINESIKREGFVYRSKDGQKSFKNVSREYLLKHS